MSMFNMLMGGSSFGGFGSGGLVGGIVGDLVTETIKDTLDPEREERRREAKRGKRSTRRKHFVRTSSPACRIRRRRWIRSCISRWRRFPS